MLNVVPFRSPRVLMRWMQVLIIASLIVTGVAIVSGVLELSLISRAMDVGITEEEGEANDARQATIGILQLVCSVATGISFFVWFYRMHKNLPGLGGRGLLYTPGWAVGYFFIPILNLVRPLQVMREVWHGSDPSNLESDLNHEGPEIRNSLGTPALAGWWWAFAIFSSLLGRIVAAMARSPNESLEYIQNTSRMFLVSDFVDLLSLVLVFWLVSRLGRWQDERNSLLRDGKSKPEPDAMLFDPEFA